MEEAEDEATRPPPTGDEAGAETQGSNRETAIEGNNAVVTGVQGFPRETLGSAATSEYMLEEGPLDDSTREEGEFSVPPTATSFYSLQVIAQFLDPQYIDIMVVLVFADRGDNGVVEPFVQPCPC